MDSEKIATNHVELAISKTGHLVSHINSNDKEPSWDGDVEVYKKSGHVHAKADLILKVPVQVKGHIKRNRQISRRMDTHGIIVVERFATFHYY